MDFFAWDYNNAVPLMNRNIPNFAEGHARSMSTAGARPARASTIPIIGRISPARSRACSAAIPAKWTASPGAASGMGPFQNAIGGTWSTVGISCFCEHCRAKARERGISADRAQDRVSKPRRAVPRRGAGPAAGGRLLRHLLAAARWSTREILSWEKLWTDSYHEVRAELYGAAKAIAPREAVRVPHHAEHDLQPVLPGRRGLLADEGLHATI